MVRFLLDRFELRLQLPLQVVQLLRTIALKVLAQLLCRNVSSDQPHECMAVFQKQLDPSLLTLQLRQLEHQNDPCHRIQYQCHP